MDEFDDDVGWMEYIRRNTYRLPKMRYPAEKARFSARRCNVSTAAAARLNRAALHEMATHQELAFTSAAAGAFGTLTSTVGRTVGLGTPRQVQLAFRFNF